MVSYIPSEDEQFELYAVCERALWTSRIIFLGVDLLLVGFAILTVFHLFTANVCAALSDLPPLTMLAILRLSRPLLRRWRVRRLRKNLPSYTEPRVLSWDSERMTFSTPTSVSSYSWRDLTKWTETKNLLIAIQGGILYIPIPKRALNEEQLGALKAELSKHGRRIGKRFST